MKKRVAILPAVLFFPALVFSQSIPPAPDLPGQTRPNTPQPGMPGPTNPNGSGSPGRNDRRPGEKTPDATPVPTPNTPDTPRTPGPTPIPGTPPNTPPR
jgi:hypothetical protein